jgi:hypothetical protein
MNGIDRAARAIGKRSGVISRMQSEEVYLSRVHNWFSRWTALEVSRIDTWLWSLSQKDLETVCNGETSVADRFIHMGPARTSRFLEQLRNL